MAKPNNIILIRHGESEGNKDRKVYKTKQDYKLSLTPKGVEQAKLAGSNLYGFLGGSNVQFYVSPFERTRQTYNEIVKFFPNSRYYESPELREQEWSTRFRVDEEFTHDIEKERDKFGTFFYRFKNGESVADCHSRVSIFLNTMFRDFEKFDFPENCVIVGHGMLNRVFLMRWFHMKYEDFETIRNPKNCEMYVLEKQMDGKYKLMTELERYV